MSIISLLSKVVYKIILKISIQIIIKLKKGDLKI